MLSKHEIDGLLEKIKQQVVTGQYQLPEQYLDLVKKDPEVWSYVARGDAAGYYYQFLALFVKHFQPKNILELGNAYGVSTVMMYSELAPDAFLTSVDILKDQRYLPENVAHDARLRMVIGDALDLNIYNGNIPQGIDFLFTDTIHFYQQVKDEYDIYRHLLNDNAFILIDDIYVKDKGKLFKELPFEKWDLSSWCHHNGFGMIRYKKEPASSNAVSLAAFASARIGFRKFNAAQAEIEDNWYRRLYRKLQQWARNHNNAAHFVRSTLKPLKNMYTPHDKKY